MIKSFLVLTSRLLLQHYNWIIIWAHCDRIQSLLNCSSSKMICVSKHSKRSLNGNEVVLWTPVYIYIYHGFHDSVFFSLLVGEKWTLKEEPNIWEEAVPYRTKKLPCGVCYTFLLGSWPLRLTEVIIKRWKVITLKVKCFFVFPSPANEESSPIYQLPLTTLVTFIWMAMLQTFIWGQWPHYRHSFADHITLWAFFLIFITN